MLISHYRFNEENVQWLTDHFLGTDYLDETRGGASSALQKMQIFLRFLGDPGFEIGVGADTGFQQSTVSRTINYVSEKIVEKKNRWIHFPTTDAEMVIAAQQWRNI
jgi:hypothetical protein